MQARDTGYRKLLLVIGLASVGVVAAGTQPQQPATSSVVVVREAADTAAIADTVELPDVGLGFAADTGKVIASVGAGVADFVVTDVGGAEFQARLVARDGSSGLALLEVEGLAMPPYRFARDGARLTQEVASANLDENSGAISLISGTVQQGQPDTTAATGSNVIRHDAFNDSQINIGSPLLNVCGEVVGAVADDDDSGRLGSGLAIQAAWLLEAFADYGLAPTPVDTPCLSTADRLAAAESAVAAAATQAAEAQARAAAAESAAAAAAGQAAEAEARAAAAAAVAVAAAESAAVADSRADSATAAAETAAVTADSAAAAAQERAARLREQYIRWFAIAIAVSGMLGLVFWLRSRHSVRRARQEKAKAETLAHAAQANLHERDIRDQMASNVPSVFLDGTDAAGQPVALRIPGSAIAHADGAIVGRNPFDSTIVLNHPEVSRRHFRLRAQGQGLFIEDLHSTNGTVLNEVPLTPGAPVLLPDGAGLKMGGLTLVVTVQ